MKTKITTKQDIINFFDFLYFHENIMPDPYSDFHDYFDMKTKENVFSPEKANLYNKIMANCCIVSEAKGIDLQRLCLQYDLYQYKTLPEIYQEDEKKLYLNFVRTRNLAARY
jgi:hypothetical protein